MSHFLIKKLSLFLVIIGIYFSTNAEAQQTLTNKQRVYYYKINDISISQSTAGIMSVTIVGSGYIYQYTGGSMNLYGDDYANYTTQFRDITLIFPITNEIHKECLSGVKELFSLQRLVKRIAPTDANPPILSINIDRYATWTTSGLISTGPANYGPYLNNYKVAILNGNLAEEGCRLQMNPY